MDEATPVVEIWPDNAAAVTSFIAMSTQWRAGAGGAVGLDYSVIPLVMRMVGIPAKERAGIFDCLRVMEETALVTMREQSKLP